MRRTPSPLLPALCLTTLLAAGCKSDLEVNAPYKNITIVYGLLSKNDTNDRHYLKINKAFLGEGNAFVHASVPDSTLYADADLHAQVEQLNAEGQVLNTFPVSSEIMDGRDPGVFPYPQHKLYYFDAALDSTSQYRISIVAKGDRLTATTAVTQVPVLSPGIVNPNSLPLNVFNGNAYVNYNLTFNSSPNGKRYEVSYRFRWREMYAVGDTSEEKSFTQLAGTVIANTVAGGQPLTVSIPGESFFLTVAEKVPMTPGVMKRIVTGFDLMWAVGGADLNTYMQLANPVSGVVEERPDYSNVDGGYGLVSSRRFRYVNDKLINGSTRTHLVHGPITGHMAFCFAVGEETVDCD